MIYNDLYTFKKLLFIIQAIRNVRVKLICKRSIMLSNRVIKRS